MIDESCSPKVCAILDFMLRKKTWRLYRHSRNVLDDFKNPSAVYRGVPFWSWNNRLNRDQLLRQIDQFREMGFGGVNIHARTGLDTEYLGQEFMSVVRDCTDRLAELGMKSWLYDEDRWPSGFAGGLVTKNHKYRAQHLLWTPTPYGQAPKPPPTTDYAIGGRSENGVLLAIFEVQLLHGRLKRYKRLRPGQKPSKHADVWYAYLETSRPGTWFGGQTYVNVFSPQAIDRFIETTHVVYKQWVGQHFGKTIPAIFTDEPQFAKKQTLGRSDEKRDLILPWSETFDETLLNHLPELVWNLPDDAPSLIRWKYHEQTAECFASAFGDRIGAWCEKNGIGLTGHLLGEGDLHSQTRGIGEAMRPLRSFHLPGIDILCDRYEYLTAKQAQSVARQLGRPGVLSEMYGVTNWDFDFVGHKAQGDWQAALGVTVRVPHLAWASMAGESKRDYPAAIGYQSPWWKEYPLIEDHFARVNSVLTRGKSVVRVAVIHPIESYWLGWGPAEQNQSEWEQRKQQIEQLTEWLVKGLIDFDFVSEGLLAGMSPTVSKNGRWVVGQMEYDAVILPNLRTIRSTTLSPLLRFARRGGLLIVAGGVPDRMDVSQPLETSKLGKCSRVIPFEKKALLDVLDPLRDIKALTPEGTLVDSLVHQIRDENKTRYVYLVNTDRHRPRHVHLQLKGHWRADRMDTFSGRIEPLTTQLQDQTTTLSYHFHAHGHLLLRLRPGRRSVHVPSSVVHWQEIQRMDGPVPVTLSEPNVLLLDQCEWKINDGSWEPREEILRIDDQVRKRLNLPLRSGRLAQPWTDPSPAPVVAQVFLKFVFQTRIPLCHSHLAIELPSADFPERQYTAELCHERGEKIRIPLVPDGWWVDESIQTVLLPRIDPGRYELILTIPMTRKTDLEWCYLLGDFGVEVSGRDARIIEPVRQLAFGDWCHQGLPFYAGNVTYHCEIRGQGKPLRLECPKYRAPLLSVSLDGQSAGKIAFAPFSLELGLLQQGKHRLDITAYGNRINAFGCLHHTDDQIRWVGPAAWRSTASAWCYEYNLRKAGILTAPIISQVRD